jgi:two-component system chemotaxis response regulator CheY
MKKCLIVDDSKVIRKFAKGILEELSFAVEEAMDGSEAISKCQQELPDLILLDWNMPVKDGMDFLNEFGEKFKDTKTKIIFCTTENELGKIKRAMDAGADEYIMKPFDIEILRGKLIQVGLIEE